MKRILMVFMSLLSHRLLSPAVCALFLLLYIGIAFFTDEALVTLVQLVGHNPLAMGLLALVAINSIIRMVADILSRRIAGKVAAGLPSAGTGSICHESIAVAGRLDTDEAARILRAEGYRVTVREGFVAARRGLSLLCPRILWRLAVCLLFVGVALSLSSRRSQRVPVIEGETLELAGTVPRTVERITLEDVPGHLFLQRHLMISLLAPDGGRDIYGIYPPGLLGANFLYPRYLAVAPLLRITEPGIGVSEGFQLIMLYPPGREDVVALSGDYKLRLVIPPREGMADPFVSGRFDLHVKLLKGDQLLSEGDVPFGGRFEAGGISVELLDARRYVVTDFVRDYGVLCIWMACAAALLAACLYLPLRLISPRREMQFAADGEGGVRAWCSSEGRTRRHEALFHDLLDRICRDR
ncbi:MAG: hypothetical protein PVSMB11_03780 [Desulfuromonadaceae bacterium]